MFMFADDTKIFRQIENDNDCKVLQSDLDALSKWANDWMLNFHPGKSTVLHFGNSNPNGVYSLNRKELQQSNTERDLGIIIDDKLKFEEHVQTKTSKARQIWGVITL